MLFKSLQDHIGKRIRSISYTRGPNQLDYITIAFEDKSQINLRGELFDRLARPPSKIDMKFYEN